MLAVLTLHLGPVLRLGAFTREVSLLLAIAAGDVVGVARLVTLLCDVVLRATVAACSRRTRFDIWTLQSISVHSYREYEVLTSLEK